MSEETYLTVEEAAEMLRVNPVTIRRMCKRGELACFRVGKLIRIPTDALMATTAAEAVPAPVGRFTALARAMEEE